MYRGLLFIAWVLSGVANAAPSFCPNIYVDNERPDVAGQEICFKHFAVVYSPETKTAVISAERITGDMVAGAERIGRINAFHSHPSIDAGPIPGDYTRSGYDRGHMTPAGDMPSLSTQRQTFSMVNMTPQTPELNRVILNSLERGVRENAKAHGEVYVVTGAVFSEYPNRIGHGVAVPDSIYKAVYIPITGQCEFTVAANNAHRIYKF